MKHLKGEGFILAESRGVRPVLEGKAWWPEYEMAGHTAPTVRAEREMNAQLAFSYAVQDPSPWDGGTHRSGGSSHID